MKRALRLLAIATLGLLPSLAEAQTGAPAERKRLSASRVTNGGISLDGRLDEVDWKSCVMASDFIQKEPNEGSFPRERTEVGFLYDDDALYIGARMYSDHPDSLRLDINRRDDPGNSEQMIVSLDTYLDKRTCCDFGVSAAGVRTDRYHSEDNEYDRDHSYNPVWDARSAVDSLGWTCEMRVPFSQLRFINRDKQVWGVNMNRWIPGRNEDNFWVAVPRNETGWSSWFGELHGIEGVRPSRRLEILPYVASGAKFTSNVDPDDPFLEGTEFDGRVGTDVKMGLGPNLTLDGTINPDFGQVEADPANVNLTDFETIFEEKRPFFIEGIDLFEAEGPTYFYSRRIGGPPHAPGLAQGDYVDMPPNTTILGASKITGRTEGGLSIGGIAALTSRESALISDNGVKSKAEVEPATGYGVVRLQQEFGEDQSTAGILFTGMARDLSDHSALAERLRGQSVAGSADWKLRFKGGAYDIVGHAGFSHVAGDSMAILRTQRSSAHYFQRPDAQHIEIDSSRTSLSGYTVGLRGGKRSGKHWLWGGGFSIESPGLELNDVGVLGSAGDVERWNHIAYRNNQPGRVFRSYYLELNSSNSWDFSAIRRPGNDPSHKSSEIEFFSEATLRNYWRAEFLTEYNFPGQSDELTRGGPWMGRYQNIYLELGLENNFAAATKYGTQLSHYSSKSGSFENAVELGFSTRAGSRWSFAIEPRLANGREARQYIDALDDGPEATYGKRYVFAKVDQSELSAQIRVNYYITPNLSVEAYAEPFAASGRYYGFGELPAPGRRDVSEYGEDGSSIEKLDDETYRVTKDGQEFEFSAEDYGVRSFRSNVVLRWEFRAGSTMYFVWQQNREGDEEPGRRVRPRVLGQTLSADGDNFFAFKISYWIPAS